MFSTSPKPARFRVTYRIQSREYWFTIPAISASAIWRSWDRLGSTLVDVSEV
jgi:hypothetical protein